MLYLKHVEYLALRLHDTKREQECRVLNTLHDLLTIMV